MIPNYLKKALQLAEDKEYGLRPIKNIEPIRARYEKAKQDLEILKEQVEKLKSFKKKKYTDEEVYAVLDSPLSAKQIGEDHVCLAIELSMGLSSLVHFLKMRDFCNGSKWHHCQNRVIIYMSRGDTAMLKDLKERNRLGLLNWQKIKNNK